MLRKILAVGMASMISQTSTQNSECLVLGASGRLGGMLRAYWPNSGALHLHARRARPGFISFDPVADADAASAAMAGKDAVLCLSGVTPARAARLGDNMATNTEVALAAVAHARRAGVPRVLLASSAAVYGSAQPPLDETSTCAPINDYGRAKLAMEQATLALGKQIGQAVTILRIGNVAGADAVLDEWAPDKGMVVLPDGTTMRRSYIGPQTLTRVLHVLCTQPTLPDIINVATPGTVEMSALLDAAGLRWIPSAPSGQVLAEVALCTKRLERFVTFAPDVSTPEAIVAEWRAYVAQQ